MLLLSSREGRPTWTLPQVTSCIQLYDSWIRALVVVAAAGTAPGLPQSRPERGALEVEADLDRVAGGQLSVECRLEDLMTQEDRGWGGGWW